MKRFLIGLMILLSTTTSVFATFAYKAASSSSSHVPRGTAENHQDVLMLNFLVGTTGAGESLKSFTFQTLSDQVYPGRGIATIKVILDDGDGAYDPLKDLTVKKTLTYGSSPDIPFDQIRTVSFDTAEAVSSDATEKRFFVVYSIDESAALAATVNFTLVDLIGDNLPLEAKTISSGATPTHNTVTITGLSTVKVFDISPDVVLPGQTKVPMLYVQLALKGELISNQFGISPIDFKFRNDSANFVTGATSNNGIVKTHFYKTSLSKENANPAVDGEPLISITKGSASIVDASNLTVHNPYTTDFTGLSETTSNFYIAYDIGEDISVENDTQIAAQFFEFIGQGDNSNLNITWPGTSAERNQKAKASSYVAGISLRSIDNIIPNNTFGADTKSTILGFKLRAHQAQVTINSITILNDGSVKYSTSPDGNTDITRVELFVDSDPNETFSETLDQRIGDVLLGNGNVSSKVKIPIVVESQPSVNGLALSKYNGSDDSTDKYIFVRYHFGSNINQTPDVSGNISATARLGEIVASANIVINTSLNITTTNILNLSGVDNDTPRDSSPKAQINIQNTNVTVIDAKSIVPAKALQGQLKVPMLLLEIKSLQSFSSTNVTIFNPAGTFSTDHTGVVKIWIYRDENDNGVFDNADVLLATRSNLSNISEAGVPGVSLKLGINKLLVLYDLGQEAVLHGSRIQAQIKDITSKNTPSIILGGELPIPITPAKLKVTAALLGKPSIVADTTVSDARVTFNANITISNSSGQSVVIQDASPRIYQKSISGSDITHEFDITPLQSYPINLNHNQTALLTFSVVHRIPITDGVGVMDSYLKYQVTSTASAVISRYFKLEWVSSSVSPVFITLESEAVNYDWSVPSYVDTISVLRGAQTLTFVNQMAIREGDKMKITFQNNARFIEESSLMVMRGTTLLKKDNPDQTEAYSYDSTTGIIDIPDLGEVDGSISLKLADFDGNALPDTLLEFVMSDAVRITRPLFFPNPYIMGGSDLTLGFNITQPAEIKLYIYNHLAMLVDQTTIPIEQVSIGYHRHTFSAFSDFLKPGMYLCLIVAKGVDGKESIIRTKLAVY